VGTYNSTGQHYRGHYSIWLTNQLQEKLVSLQDILIDPRLITNWVNGNLYQRTSEVSGILPIPADIRHHSGMSDYDPLLDAKQPHHFLAKLQGTRKAILPVHNLEEQELFCQLMRTDLTSNSTAQPNWSEAVRVWNRHADMNQHISYKVCLHFCISDLIVSY
jgi:hypothetical protein